jgi:hypothetical protein
LAELESPASADELYLYRGDEVPRTRPIFQGDVFDDLEIPGFDGGPGLAMVITHACTMRQGPALRERLVVARVLPTPNPIALPWKGNFRSMPLPALIPDAAPGHWALNFEDIGAVLSKDLDLTKRVACLDDRGVVLLQQRHAHHFTRYVVETEVLYEQSANVLVEAELLEAWLSAATDETGDGYDERASQEATEFDAFVRPLRDDLKDPSRRASVRRTVNQEIRRRFG